MLRKIESKRWHKHDLCVADSARKLQLTENYKILVFAEINAQMCTKDISIVIGGDDGGHISSCGCSSNRPRPSFEHGMVPRQ